MKLTVNGRDIELTASEARELHRQLNDIFGIQVDYTSPLTHIHFRQPDEFVKPEPWDKKWEVTC